MSLRRHARRGSDEAHDEDSINVLPQTYTVRDFRHPLYNSSGVMLLRLEQRARGNRGDGRGYDHQQPAKPPSRNILPERYTH